MPPLVDLPNPHQRREEKKGGEEDKKGRKEGVESPDPVGVIRADDAALIIYTFVVALPAQHLLAKALL